MPTDATPPAGFTVVSGLPVSYGATGGFRFNCYAWTKIASGESGPYVVTHAANSSQGFVCFISGAGSVDVALTTLNVTDNGAGGTTTTALGLTTTGDGSLVFFMSGSIGDAATTSTTPAGATPTFTTRLNTSATGVMYVASGPLAVAGATGDKTQTNNNVGTGGWLGSLFVFPPFPFAAPPFMLTRQAVNRAASY